MTATYSGRNMTRTLRSHFLFALAFAMTAVPSWAQDIGLEFTPTSPTPSTASSFISSASGKVDRSSLNSSSSLVPTSSVAQKYVLYLDSDSYRRDKSHRFALDAYIKATSDPADAQMSKFFIWEDPTGSFPDSIASVSGQITGKAGIDTITVRLPQHSDDSPNLSVIAPDKPYPISMGSDRGMTLGIKNALSNLHVDIVGDSSKISVRSDDCPKCWKSISGSIEPSRIPAGGSATLNVLLQPNTLEILSRNWFPTATDSEQQKIVIMVTSQSQLSGLEVPQYFVIPIRFTPPPGLLILALLIGAALGVVMKILMASDTSTNTWKVYVFQFLLSLVAWGVLLVLFIAKTKATIFGYELDPTALLPASLITLFAAGGPAVVDKIKQLL